MKNITFSADEAKIEAARAKARRDHSTLNDEFRRWLDGYVEDEVDGAERARRAMETIDRIRAYTGTGGRKFTREEMNER